MADNDALLTNQMPHSPQAEQAVLGSMLIDADCVKDVMDQLQTQDFYLRTNRDIFETIYQMFVYSKPIDGVTVAGEMEKNGKSNEQTRSYLVQLMEVTPTSANVMEYVRIVQEKSLMRQVAFAAGRITAMVQQGTGSAGDMLEAAEQRIYAIRRGRSAQGMVPVSMVLGDVMSQLAELSARGGKSVPGLSTGLSAVDAKINGMNKSDLLLLAARPGMGKTSMALNVALSAARESGKTVAIFSLEMSEHQLVQRMISLWGKIPQEQLSTGRLSKAEGARFFETADLLRTAPLFINETPAISTLELRSQARRLKAEHGLGLIVVDYLQLMRSSRRTDSRELEISDISRSLKAIAKELDVPVVALSQLNRKVEERKDNRPMLSDLRESGAIEQDADIVIFLYRDEVYKPDTPKKGIAELIIGKHRNGRVGTVELAFLPQYTAFEPLAKDR